MTNKIKLIPMLGALSAVATIPFVAASCQQNSNAKAKDTIKSIKETTEDFKKWGKYKEAKAEFNIDKNIEAIIAWAQGLINDQELEAKVKGYDANIDKTVVKPAKEAVNNAASKKLVYALTKKDGLNQKLADAKKQLSENQLATFKNNLDSFIKIVKNRYKLTKSNDAEIKADATAHITDASAKIAKLPKITK